MSDDAFALAISLYFRDKLNVATPRPNREGQPSAKYAYVEFHTTRMTPDAVIRHVTSGKALCVAALAQDYRTSANFRSSQLIGVDFDNGPDVDTLAREPLVYEHSFLVYPTPSSTPAAPRARALFRLDQPVTDAAAYSRYVLRLLTYFSREKADEQCKDVVRLFYGSTKPGYSRVASAVLPLAVLDALPAHPSELPKPPPPPREVVTYTGKDATRAEKYAVATREALIREALSVPAGAGERHKAFNDLLMKLAARAKGGWPGFDGLAAIAADVGARMDRDKDEIERSLRGAMTKADAFPLRLADDAPARKATDEHPAAPAVPAPNGTPPPAPSPAPVAVTWKTSDDALAAYRTSLRVAPDLAAAPLVWPYRPLAAAGGLCQVIPPGLMVGIVGLSGGLKTAFVETVTDRWRQMDANHVLWWGPEWTPERMADRAVQRYGGPPMTEKLMHELALYEAREGVVPDKRYGKPLSADQIALGEETAARIAAWPGKAHFVEPMDLDIADLLDACRTRAEALRAAGTPLRVAVFDYLQLLNMRSVRTEQDRITQVLGLLKAFCVDCKLVGVVASQVTKQAGQGVREGDDTLGAEAGQFLRSDKFNLVVTLNPVWKADALTNRGTLVVAKNSLGRTLKRTVVIDPARFLWTDIIVDDTLVPPPPAREAAAMREVQF